MIEVVFTIDYEIYGNGTGNLREHVYEPAERLLDMFRLRNKRFVPFVEVAEFDVIEGAGTDSGIGLVKRQIQEFHRDGFEIGLHLHPQWYNARQEGGQWVLDYDEYNLCVLPRKRVAEIVDRALTYLRQTLHAPSFTPLSFRAGNWLFLPSHTVADVLSERGFKIDSSVFKGGLQHRHNLDYRPSLRHGYYWWFTDDANTSTKGGPWLEIPVYADMVPFWRMLTTKRVGLQATSASTSTTLQQRWDRVRDYARPRYPLKFDFCRMTFDELTTMMNGLLREDRKTPDVLKPVVAIGHTKDLTDFETVGRFLSFLDASGIGVSTFEDIYSRLSPPAYVERAQ